MQIKALHIGGVAKIKIYDYIGLYTHPTTGAIAGVSGAEVAGLIDYLSDNAEAEGTTEIELQINSYGGAVIDGLMIYSAMMRSKIPVNTCIDGVAASMAGIVALGGRKVKMYDYAVLMLHNPLFTHKEADAYTDTEKAQIEATTKQLLTIYTAKTGLSEAKIAKMMQSTTWLLATDCKKNGFVDEILTPESTKQTPAVNSEKDTIQAVYASFDKWLNGTHFIEPEVNPLKMDKIKAVLGIGEANEDAIATKIKAVLTERDTLKAQVSTLTATLEEKQALVAQIEQERAEAQEARCVELVENAVKAKKIGATLKDSYLKLARLDYVEAEKVLNALASVERFSERKTESNEPLTDLERLKTAGWMTMAEKNKSLAKR